MENIRIADDARSGRRADAIIYALVDPRDGAVKYIGKTEIPKVRLRLHIWETGRNDTEKSLWIRDLLAVGLVPEMRALEVVPVDKDWGEAERRHIAFAKARGSVLLNGTSGGQGVPDSARGEAWRLALKASHVDNPRRKAGARAAAQKNRGRKHTEEHRAKIGAAHRGRTLPQEHRQKISDAQRGKPRNPQSIEKMRQSLTGRKQPEETNEKRRRTMLAKREQQAKRQADNWKDPAYREMMISKMRGRRASPKTREKLSLVMKERWKRRHAKRV